MSPLEFWVTTHTTTGGSAVMAQRPLRAWYLETWIELVTYPPCFLLVKAWTYSCIILLVAEVCARRSSWWLVWKTTDQVMTPRDVPLVITGSVVVGSLTIICADWAFSQLLLQRI